MRRMASTFSLIIFAIMLSACATVSQQTYKAPAEPIKTVLITAQDQFPKVRVGLGGNPGLMFGALGAAAAAAGAASQEELLHNAVSSQGIVYQERLLEQIRASLAAADIQSETVFVKRERSFLLEDYKPLVAQKNVDAVLDFFVSEASFGGTHPLLDPKPRPILHVTVRLVSTKKFETLYAEELWFGDSNPFSTARTIKSPEKYYFQNLEEVIEDKARAAEGLRLAVDEVARSLVQQFVPVAVDAKNPKVATAVAQ